MEGRGQCQAAGLSVVVPLHWLAALAEARYPKKAMPDRPGATWPLGWTFQLGWIFQPTAVATVHVRAPVKYS